MCCRKQQNKKKKQKENNAHGLFREINSPILHKDAGHNGSAMVLTVYRRRRLFSLIFLHVFVLMKHALIASYFFLFRQRFMFKASTIRPLFLEIKTYYIYAARADCSWQAAWVYPRKHWHSPEASSQRPRPAHSVWDLDPLPTMYIL